MPTDPELRLNLGAEDTSLEGYVPIDSRNGDSAYPLRYDDNSVAEIYASHLLEHFSYRIVPDVLKHWIQKLKPGGRLRLSVPNFEWLANAYLKGDPINIQGFVMGSQEHDGNHHRALFDRDSLSELMMEAGLERLHEWTPEIEDCSVYEFSLNLAGYKPICDVQVCRDTMAILSAPRYSPTIHMRVASDAFFNTRVPYMVCQGVYWHQVLCETIEKALSSEQPRYKYVITCDYDSIFSGVDVLNLYRLMDIFPQADAICGLQSKRQNKESILCNLRDADGQPRTEIPELELLSKQLTPILSGHFGLTIFRAESLRKHERPWMVAAPNTDNRWGDHRLDADMDFWKRWHKAGHKSYMATHVVVGHMEEVIAWPGAELKPVYQLVSDFAKTGKPVNVWPQLQKKYLQDAQAGLDSDSCENGADSNPATS